MARFVLPVCLLVALFGVDASWENLLTRREGSPCDRTALKVLTDLPRDVGSILRLDVKQLSDHNAHYLSNIDNDLARWGQDLAQREKIIKDAENAAKFQKPVDSAEMLKIVKLGCAGATGTENCQFSGFNDCGEEEVFDENAEYDYYDDNFWDAEVPDHEKARSDGMKAVLEGVKGRNLIVDRQKFRDECIKAVDLSKTGKKLDMCNLLCDAFTEQIKESTTAPTVKALGDIDYGPREELKRKIAKAQVEKSDCEESQKKVDTLLTELTTLSKTYRGYNDNCDEARFDLNQLRFQLVTIIDNQNSIASEIAKVAGEIEEGGANADAARKLIEDFKKEIARVQGEQEKTQGVIDVLEDKIQKTDAVEKALVEFKSLLSSELAAIVNQWRSTVTTPLETEFFFTRETAIEKEFPHVSGPKKNAEEKAIADVGSRAAQMKETCTSAIEAFQKFPDVANLHKLCQYEWENVGAQVAEQVEKKRDVAVLLLQELQNLLVSSSGQQSEEDKGTRSNEGEPVELQEVAAILNKEESKFYNEYLRGWAVRIHESAEFEKAASMKTGELLLLFAGVGKCAIDFAASNQKANDDLAQLQEDFKDVDNKMTGVSNVLKELVSTIAAKTDIHADAVKRLQKVDADIVNQNNLIKELEDKIRQFEKDMARVAEDLKKLVEQSKASFEPKGLLQMVVHRMLRMGRNKLLGNTTMLQ